MAQAAVVFIGDEVTAQGYRLAGAQVCTPAEGAELDGFRDACGQAQVVLLDSEYAERLPPDLLDAALAAIHPLVLILPRRIAGGDEYGPADRVRRILGFEA